VREGSPPPVALYVRVLRLQGLAPNTWQRMLLVEGVFIIAGILVLADVASAWTLIVLPVMVALMVKLNDVIEVATRSGGRHEIALPDLTLPDGHRTD
jgi:hypothetical protein